MNIQDATVLVTGANRGLGLEFAREALARGARKVYAAARDPSGIRLSGVTPIRMDVTDPLEVAAAAAEFGDVTIVVNNAGIARGGSLLGSEGARSVREHLETNCLGMLAVSEAFAPVLARHGGGALLNVLSVVSWVSSTLLPAYAISKSAAWGLTNALRLALAPHGTQVLGLHVGFIDTDLTRGFDVPKVSPQLVAARGFEALERGESEVLVDDVARHVKQGLVAPTPVYLQPVPRPAAA